MRGNDIKVLQVLLNLLPDNIVATKVLSDGILGSSTRMAVKEFHRYFGLRADGVADTESFFCLGHRTGKYAQGEPVFSSRILKCDSRGGDVLVLQSRLAAFRKTYLNRPGGGSFNSQTKEAVKRFQEDFPPLNADGIAAPLTFDQIFMQAPLGGRTLRRGKKGLDVYLMQLYLYYLQYYNRQPKGHFDVYTEKALKAFQNDAQIKSDGAAGPQTYLALGSSIAFPQKTYLYRTDKGDSLFTIAALFNSSMEEIIKLNNLKPPDYTITAGLLLQLPMPLTYHLAQKGDTLSDLSKKYAIAEADLKKANNLLPESYVIPGEMVLLPRYRQELSGDVAFIKTEKNRYQLRTLNLNSGSFKTRESFGNLSSKAIFLAKDRKRIGLFADDGRTLINTDLGTGITKKFSLPASASYMDWSYDNNKIVVGGGTVIDAHNGQELFSFGGSAPRWMRDNKTLIYYGDKTAFKKINIETGMQRDLFSLPGYYVWAFYLSGDDSRMLVFAYVPPGRMSISLVYDLHSRQLAETSSNDFIGVWPRNPQTYLLCSRDYYGEFFPWFYQNIKLYTGSGSYNGTELYGKGVEINADNFHPDDSAFLNVMFNPGIFYPLAQNSRDIYVKKINSRLITQLTAGEIIYSPVWL